MSNKEIRYKRNRGYFIDATREIIDKEGIEAVTIRKVAKMAGYNSATLYNYFNNVDHLISIALSHHIGTYIETISNMIDEKDSAYDIYCKLWLEYIDESFYLPKVYYYIFFRNLTVDVSDVYKEYFENHPQKLKDLPVAVQKMLTESNAYNRDLAFLVAEFPHIAEEDLKRMSEMNILIYRSMLYDLQLPGNEDLKEEYIKRYKNYFNYLTQILR